jgi:hypothetical protein
MVDYLVIIGDDDDDIDEVIYDHPRSQQFCDL